LNAIEVRNLVKKYKNKTVLNNLNLTIKEGEFYCLMGPNGSGKTTLSSIIASIRKQTSGKAVIFGKVPNKAKDLIGYIPQENFSDPHLTGRENLRYFTRMLGYTSKETGTMTRDLIKKVGLSEDADKRAGKYSGGMKKKLELATILYPGIKVLILDEPTTGLDPSSRRKFFGLIDEVKDKSTTILLITHLGSDAELASRVGLIDNGVIIAEGSPKELKNNNKFKSIINIVTSIKNDRVRDILNSFNQGDELLETEEGYKIYSDDSAEMLPKIVRTIEGKGYKVVQIGSTEPSLEDVFFKLTGKQIREVK
jgi:ABC-2 type transport system ATP-binding protein